MFPAYKATLSKDGNASSYKYCFIKTQSTHIQ
jgi:hypothetical protein